MKTNTTKILEKMLLGKFDVRRDFFVFECMIGWAGHHNEIVDCICYNTNREIICYEIKQSVSDFHSDNALTFIGNKNYYVMPYDLYEKVKDEIPKEIGVYVACKQVEKEVSYPYGTTYYCELQDGFETLYCIKPAKSRMLRADKEVILSSMLRCACRDRYRETGIFSYPIETVKTSNVYADRKKMDL